MGKNLYVGNMSYDTTQSKLQELFAVYGEVTSVNIITDGFTGWPRGFAFVEMASEQASSAAIAGLNRHEADGRTLTVNEARPREPRTGGSGGGRGGRDGGRRGGHDRW